MPQGREAELDDPGEVVRSWTGRGDDREIVAQGSGATLVRKSTKVIHRSSEAV